MVNFNDKTDNSFEQFDQVDPFENALKKNSNPESKKDKQPTRKKRDKTAPRPAWQILLILPAFFIAVPAVYVILVNLIPDKDAAGTVYFILFIGFVIFVGFKSHGKRGDIKWKK